MTERMWNLSAFLLSLGCSALFELVRMVDLPSSDSFVLGPLESAKGGGRSTSREAVVHWLLESAKEKDMGALMRQLPVRVQFMINLFKFSHYRVHSTYSWDQQSLRCDYYGRMLRRFSGVIFYDCTVVWKTC
jgi:hypothetical protein